jgi:hypothetical protein
MQWSVCKVWTCRHIWIVTYSCICRYVPALRPLRQIAQVFNIKRVPSTVIAQRLKSICSQEGLSADIRTLCALVDAADGDIRTCLNTLQVRECIWLTHGRQTLQFTSIWIPVHQTSLHPAHGWPCEANRYWCKGCQAVILLYMGRDLPA